MFMTNKFKPGDVVTYRWYAGDAYTVVIHEGSDENGYVVFSALSGIGGDRAPKGRLKRITDD